MDRRIKKKVSSGEDKVATYPERHLSATFPVGFEPNIITRREYFPSH